jgi:hypothetical protein
VIGGKAEKKAAKAQERGQQAQIAELRRQFDLQRADLAPFREASNFALQRLQSLISDPSQVQNLPGFEFRQEQGRAQLENIAAAGGDLLSGTTLQGLTEFGQNFATNEVNAEFNRLASLAGLSGQGVGAGVQAGGALSAQIGNVLGAQGAAQAGSFLRRGAQQQQAIGDISSNLIFSGNLGRVAPTTPITAGGPGPQFATGARPGGR